MCLFLKTLTFIIIRIKGLHVFWWNWLTWLLFLLGSLTVTLTVLLVWISSFLLDASICSTMTFSLLGNSHHVVASVSIDFPSNSKPDTLFHQAAYDHSSADWDSFRVHLRNVPWEDIFEHCAASEYFEWVQVGIDISLIVYIPHCKYQVTPRSSPWFSGHRS